MDQSKRVLQEFTIEGKHHKPITLDIRYIEKKPVSGVKLPIVILSHGFKGFKDWGTFNLVADTFAQHGFFFVKFNYSHNGTSANDFSDIHDTEAFGMNNFEIELDDLGSVINWLEDLKNPYYKIYDFNALYLVGHSRGAGISILKTVQDSRVKKVASWAGVNDLEKYMHLSSPEVWKEKGVSFVENSRTKINLPLYYQFFENYYKNESRFDIKKNLMNLDKPLLLLHGTNDSIVKMEDSEWIYNHVDHSIFVKIEGANHTFGGQHPWEKETLPEDLNFAIEETIEFFTF